MIVLTPQLAALMHDIWKARQGVPLHMQPHESVLTAALREQARREAAA